MILNILLLKILYYILQLDIFYVKIRRQKRTKYKLKEIFMRKIAVVTDSNSGILQKEAEEMKDVYVIPMPFTIDGEEYFEDINLTQEQFYKKLENDAAISTSQPSIGSITELWDKPLKDYEYIIHIPMSSALSMSCETAQNFAKDYNGKVLVVDNKRISVTMKQSVIDALKLIDRGEKAEDIKEYLEKTALDSSIYIMVDTLKYLKRGGRVTPAAAAIGTLLKIKPVLQIQGGKLDKFVKVRNLVDAKEKMISAVKADLEGRFKEFKENGELVLQAAYTNCKEKADKFVEEIKEAFPDIPFDVCDPLSLSVACHIGSGALAITCCRVVK